MQSTVLLSVVVVAVLMCTTTEGFRLFQSLTRETLHRLDPLLFAREVPQTPFSDQVADLQIHEVVSRFAVASVSAAVSQLCEEESVALYDELSAACMATMHDMSHASSALDPRLLHRALAQALLRLQSARQAVHPSFDSVSSPYFGFIPQHLGSVAFDELGVLPPTPQCATTLGVTAQLNDSDGVVMIAVDAYRSNESSLCVDDVLFTVGPSSTSILINGTGRYFATTKVDVLRPSMVWDAYENGVRIFRYAQASSLERVLDVIDTLLLFIPLLTNHLDESSAVHNVDFLSNFSLMTPYPVPRAYPHRVNLTTATAIRSGDMFAKMALDGLGPIESFAQGTTSGHAAIALWNESSNTLYVCESIEHGITCTEYEEWLANMQAIGANIVMAPLSSSMDFNVTAAWEHVHQFLGNSYGYFNFFFGWVDTEEDNYPCMPNSWERCLSYSLVEYVMLFLDEVVPEVANIFFGQALNHRIGASDRLGQSISETLQFARQSLGLSGRKLMTVPESDAWLYNSTKLGVPGRLMLPSQVCSSFACSTLQAAGSFERVIASNITCTEIDVWDIFSFRMFDEQRMNEGRPAACVDADPSNALCQLSGTWTFHLMDDVNSRLLQPQMSHHCASRNPRPYNRTGC